MPTSRTKGKAPSPALDATPEVEDDGSDAEASAQESGSGTPVDGRTMTMDERNEKMNLLRRRLHETSQANRKDVVKEHNRHRQTVQEAKRLERKRKQAELLEERLDAEETGEDLERKRNWEYSIEDNERWDKKQSRKTSRGQFEFTDYDDAARRKYKKDMDTFKPDLAAYNAQRKAVLADVTSGGPADDALVAGGSGSVQRANELLYRDANSFVYADHKPSDDAIDRVVQHINLDLDKRNKRSRTRKEDEGDVTYINDRNKHFNKKLERFFNKYTKDIRENFERGTAL